VTVAGPGGIGKTRLALATARPLLDQFRDGVYFVDLAPLAAPAEVPLAIAAALDYTAPDQTRELFPQLLGRLAQAEMLLILDNCEHLRDGAPLVSDLLQACPQVAILTTSRQRLKLASESVWDVSGLDYPTRPAASDAWPIVPCSCSWTTPAGRGPALSWMGRHSRLVIHICQLVQGMPLALVLAASWSAVLIARGNRRGAGGRHRPSGG
jgi:predicted ATPase